MKTYIFDLDGTLLDSMHVWEQIDIEFLMKRGFLVPADYKYAVGSLSFKEAAQYTIKRFLLPDSVEQLCLEWLKMAEYAYSHTVPLKPYAKEYITLLKTFPVKLAVATSLSKPLYEAALKNHQLYNAFDVICCTEEINIGKSKPDIFYYTAKKLGVSPSTCIVFEDILAAIKSAKEAGMTVYGMYDKSSENHWEEIKKIADGVFYDFKNAPLPN